MKVKSHPKKEDLFQNLLNHSMMYKLFIIKSYYSW